jgi:uncharacterized protein
MIIDVHNHLGYDVVFDEGVTEDELFGTLESNKVDIGIVQPLVVETTHEAQRAAHDEVAALIKKYPGRFYGMASLNPHSGEDYYRAEMKRAIKELGFLGVKISPIAHAVNPAGKHGRMAFDVAREHKVPIMVHTGSGIPFALPAPLLPLAREFKEIPLVIAHAGSWTADTLVVANECDNVFLDTSWAAAHVCSAFVKQLGASRLMLASDLPSNLVVELAKWRSLNLSEADLDAVMWKTAATVYGIKV